MALTYLGISRQGRRIEGDAELDPHFSYLANGTVNLRAGRAGDDLRAVVIRAGAVSIAGVLTPRTGTSPVAGGTARTLYTEPADPWLLPWAGPVVINDTWVMANAYQEVRRYWIRGWSWRSMITGVNAVDVQTLIPLGFEFNNLMGLFGSGTGRGIIGSTTGHQVDLIVRDNSIYGPGLHMSNGQAAGRPVFIYWKRLIWYNNNFRQCGGLGANDWFGDNSGAPSLYFGYNDLVNIDSRTRDSTTATGYLRGHQEGLDYHFVQGCQLAKVRGIKDALIEHNRMTFTQNNGFVEDNVNVNSSSGIPSSWIKVRFNLIDGAGSNEIGQIYAGGGTALGDGGGQFQESTDNVILETGNYAVASAGGRDQLLARNLAIGMGYADDGVTGIDADTDAGVFVRDYNETMGTDMPRDPASIRVIQNRIGWWSDNPPGPSYAFGRNDLYISDHVAGQATANPPIPVATLGTGSEMNTFLNLPDFPVDPAQRGPATAAWLQAKADARATWNAQHRSSADLVGRRNPA
jgi:hypothetical protein